MKIQDFLTNSQLTSIVQESCERGMARITEMTGTLTALITSEVDDDVTELYNRIKDSTLVLSDGAIAWIKDVIDDQDATLHTLVLSAPSQIDEWWKKGAALLRVRYIDGKMIVAYAFENASLRSVTLFNKISGVLTEKKTSFSQILADLADQYTTNDIISRACASYSNGKWDRFSFIASCQSFMHNLTSGSRKIMDLLSRVSNENTPAVTVLESCEELVRVSDEQDATEDTIDWTVTPTVMESFMAQQFWNVLASGLQLVGTGILLIGGTVAKIIGAIASAVGAIGQVVSNLLGTATEASPKFTMNTVDQTFSNPIVDTKMQLNRKLLSDDLKVTADMSLFDYLWEYKCIKLVTPLFVVFIYNFEPRDDGTRTYWADVKIFINMLSGPSQALSSIYEANNNIYQGTMYSSSVHDTWGTSSKFGNVCFGGSGRQLVDISNVTEANADGLYSFYPRIIDQAPAKFRDTIGYTFSAKDFVRDTSAAQPTALYNYSTYYKGLFGSASHGMGGRFFALKEILTETNDYAEVRRSILFALQMAYVLTIGIPLSENREPDHADGLNGAPFNPLEYSDQQTAWVPVNDSLPIRLFAPVLEHYGHDTWEDHLTALQWLKNLMEVPTYLNDRDMSASKSKWTPVTQVTYHRFTAATFGGVFLYHLIKLYFNQNDYLCRMGPASLSDVLPADDYWHDQDALRSPTFLYDTEAFFCTPPKYSIASVWFAVAVVGVIAAAVITTFAITKMTVQKKLQRYFISKSMQVNDLYSEYSSDPTEGLDPSQVTPEMLETKNKYYHTKEGLKRFQKAGRKLNFLMKLSGIGSYDLLSQWADGSGWSSEGVAIEEALSNVSGLYDEYGTDEIVVDCNTIYELITGTPPYPED